MVFHLDLQSAYGDDDNRRRPAARSLARSREIGRLWRRVMPTGDCPPRGHESSVVLRSGRGA